MRGSAEYPRDSLVVFTVQKFLEDRQQRGAQVQVPHAPGKETFISVNVHILLSVENVMLG